MQLVKPTPVRLVLLVMILAAAASAVADVPVFGPKTYSMPAGSGAQTFSETIPLDVTAACSLDAQYLIVVQNGDASGGGRADNGELTFNGEAVARSGDFSASSAGFTRPVLAKAGNTLALTLRTSGRTAATATVTVVRRARLPLFSRRVELSDAATTATFTAPASGTYRLIVENGDAAGESRVSSATVDLNGTRVVAESDFNQTTSIVEKSVALQTANTIVVALKAGPRTPPPFIVVRIVADGADTTAPVITVTSPLPNSEAATPSVNVVGTVIDAASRVASFTVNGVAVPLTAGGAFSHPLSLAAGPNTITLVATDCEGNRAQASLAVTYDSTPPQVTITSPLHGTSTNASPLLVTGTATDNVGVVSLTVNDVAVPISGTTFSHALTLREGENVVIVAATDQARNSGSATTVFTIDRTAPVLQVDSPTTDLTNAPDLIVRGSAADNSGSVAVTVNGAGAPLGSEGFSANVALVEGANTLAIIARDAAGNATSDIRSIVRYSVPRVTITSPANLAMVSSTSVNVAGTISDRQARIVVNGVNATVTGNSFAAVGVPIREGGNVLSATATDTFGHIGTASVTVVRDTTAPRVVINYPADNAVVTQPSIAISGMVNDIVVGTVNRGEVMVTVNGLATQIANRTFSRDVTLVSGDNTITAIARDISGNQSSATIKVRYQAPAPDAIAVVSGHQQTATVGALLPQPLVVRVTKNGAAAANVPVTFRVKGTDGSLDGGVRVFTTNTNAAGEASARFTLGSRAGVANQVVEATATGINGTATFLASATGSTAARLLVDMGEQQTGITGQPLPVVFAVIVTDTQLNRLGNVPVLFSASEGNGRFPNGERSMIVPSDSDGNASITLTLGPDAGINNNIVDVALADAPQTVLATFTASAKVAGDPAQTTISGVVLDNQNEPVAGVGMHVKGTLLHATSAADGTFRIAGAPVGTVMLEVDGTTAQRPGTWPHLEFMLVTIAGQDNTVGSPIYLLPIDVARGVSVDATRGGTIALPEVPGLTMTIAPGSVTFPGGGKTGTVSVTLVHSDKVPMVPNFGQQPRMAITIQPAGAAFNPPAAVTFPNVEGLPPGRVVDLYSFDHDLGMFVAIGPGTVSEDGRVVASNPGVGILKAGWHMAVAPPPPTGSASNTSVRISEGQTDPPIGAASAPPSFKQIAANATAPQTVAFPSEIWLIKGRTSTVKAKANPPFGTYEWSSEDNTIASVSGSGAIVVISANRVGTTKIKVKFTALSTGSEATGELQVRVRTSQIIAVQWVDADLIPMDLLTLTAGPDVLEGTSNPGDCALMMTHLLAGIRHVYIHTDNDRKYLNGWLLAHSDNAEPPNPITAAYAATRDYRSFNMLEGIWGGTSLKIESPSARNLAFSGPTPDPCGFLDPKESEAHEDNGKHDKSSSGGTYWSLAEGRVGFIGQLIDSTINDPFGVPTFTTPWIWSVIRFDARGNLLVPLDRSIFPTWALYVDGVRIEAAPQPDPELFISFDKNYQRKASELY